MSVTGTLTSPAYTVDWTVPEYAVDWTATSNWILFGGIWNDSGIWDDNSNWIG